MRFFTLVLGLAFLVSGCARNASGPDLMSFPASDGPDEFLTLPTKPLQSPPDYASLPTPTPGGVNLVDPTPRADAIAALGGRSRAGSTGDTALLSYTTRFGVAGDIRPALAASDLEFRRANDGLLLERMFNVNLYYDSYAPQSLDRHRELERFRAAGVPTPAAPPPLGPDG